MAATVAIVATVGATRYSTPFACAKSQGYDDPLSPELIHASTLLHKGNAIHVGLNEIEWIFIWPLQERSSDQTIALDIQNSSPLSRQDVSNAKLSK